MVFLDVDSAAKVYIEFGFLFSQLTANDSAASDCRRSAGSSFARQIETLIGVSNVNFKLCSFRATWVWNSTVNLHNGSRLWIWLGKLKPRKVFRERISKMEYSEFVWNPLMVKIRLVRRPRSTLRDWLMRDVRSLLFPLSTPTESCR